MATDLLLIEQNGGVVADFTLTEGETAVFGAAGHSLRGRVWPTHYPRYLQIPSFEVRWGYWRNWLRKSNYTGRWREMVERSALLLKLLTFEPTGAIVAAPHL